MSRSLKKGFFVDPFLMEKIIDSKKHNTKKAIITYSRRSTITPDFVGLNFKVHNGKKFIEVHITENMVGHKLGEFSHTRIFRGHSNKSTDKKNK